MATQRDDLAGQAMIILIPMGITGEVDDFGPKEVAHTAYQYADAMLGVRALTRTSTSKPPSDKLIPTLVYALKCVLDDFQDHGPQDSDDWDCVRLAKNALARAEVEHTDAH